MNDSNEQVRELLGAWALNAVDDVERAAVERAIAADADLAAEARELRETVGRLAEADAQQPPEHVREAVLAQIRVTSQDQPPARDRTATHPQHATPDPAPGGASRRERGGSTDELNAMRRRRRWQALAAAAAFIVAVALPTVVAINQADRAGEAEQAQEQAEQQAELAQDQADQIAEALTHPEAQLVGEDLPDGSRAVAVLSQDSALFTAQGMTDLDDQDYQLWVLEGEQATSAGVLDWDEGRLTAHVEQFPADGALAITAEPLGGSDQPTSDPLVVLGAS
ncbi:MAG TPA: anti-sigma factor [Beutenbergiaceae bacterium]|nr:anti-sigma factor [Beutenbergiaceae bacterium]